MNNWICTTCGLEAAKPRLHRVSHVSGNPILEQYCVGSFQEINDIEIKLEKHNPLIELKEWITEQMIKEPELALSAYSNKILTDVLNKINELLERVE